MCIDECNCIGTHLKDIVNHSFNLKKNNDDCRDDIGTSYIEGIDIYLGYDESEIKTILTHEQYERNCYRLEDN